MTHFDDGTSEKSSAQSATAPDNPTILCVLLLGEAQDLPSAKPQALELRARVEGEGGGEAHPGEDGG